ncbi:Estradiol 17-beta-dehydrogenase 8 [Chionoecetes opilio]|uniref:(3R)-3-hydroxyacyl-CoA dehydrogenase n=1 Tax=Chionoecetes opilio TaxID=41210 RepID=A0A8J8WC24_CHIOP|nr:Estradiol 17-beta-dehydrogenase 8 [Chionoecetes opilio]
MFSGRIALVTGGGNGIGRAICQILARDGARVVAADMDHAAAQDTVRMLNGTPASGEPMLVIPVHEKIENNNSPHDHISLMMDVTDKASVESAFSAAIDKFKAPPSLVANGAGITRPAFLMQMDEKAFMDVLDVNLKGTFLVTKAAVAALVEDDASSGAIVNISSLAGKAGTMGQCNYSASKAGVMAFTKTAAMELASIGVRVNCVLPGFTETAMLDDVPEKVMKKLIKITPLNRLAKPAEIAEVVTFLLSDKSSYMTGACVEVTGGLGM